MRAVSNPYGEAERVLFRFAAPADLALWRAFADSEYGGKSTATLQILQDEPVRAAPAGEPGSRHACWAASAPVGHVRLGPRGSQPAFHGAPCPDLSFQVHLISLDTRTVQGTAELAGNYSTGVQEGGAHERLRRSGFCGMHSQVRWAGWSRRGLLALATPIGACLHPQCPRKPRSPWQHTSATHPASCYVRLGPPALWARGVLGQETSSPVLIPLLHSCRRAPSLWTSASTTAWCSG